MPTVKNFLWWKISACIAKLQNYFLAILRPESGKIGKKGPKDAKLLELLFERCVFTFHFHSGSIPVYEVFGQDQLALVEAEKSPEVACNIDMVGAQFSAFKVLSKPCLSLLLVVLSEL